jgi:hypothetical protein
MCYFLEQSVFVKFCFKLGKIFSETFEMLKQAFGDESVSLIQTYELYKRFKICRSSIEYEPRSGRPSTSKVDQHVENVCEVLRSRASGFHLHIVSIR